MAVALLTFTACSGSADDTQGGEKVPGPREAIAVWPEDTRDDLLAARERVDAGEDPWRLDAAQTAAEFAGQVLGWPTAIVGTPEPADGVDQFIVERDAGGPAIRVSMVQVLEPLWSVSSVNSADESFNPAVSVRGIEATVIAGVEPYDSALVEVGHGAQVVTGAMPSSGEFHLALPSPPTTGGHLLILFFDESGEVASAFASPLPAGDTAAG